MNTPLPDPDPAPNSFYQLWCYLWKRRTTAFGYIVIALGYVCANDVFPHNVQKYFLFANGLVMVCLGHYNNSVIKRSQENLK